MKIGKTNYHSPFGDIELHVIQPLTREIPYSLLYGIGVVLPIEIVTPLIKVIAESKILELEWAKDQYKELIMLAKRRL